MKNETIVKTLRVIEARTRLEQARLAGLRRRARALLAAADAFETEARRAPQVEPAPEEAGALLIAARYRALLERRAAQKRAEAAALEPALAEQANRLKASLREEIMWRTLRDEAAARRRKRVNDREEEWREELARR
ncbi:hypothetical protein [Amphiplicatus metriothermophilus]|uniref:Flagellar FliJ protein n=1 Tax=Amphiplicatus metriothermophilus TaxID=1519374 RepID=A0A239PL32_9PROT|nr:hypothetical protein [Amphiplicatus metriothermophilus]MBB5517337.1 hypothetical protein [Amphiplicatus metriothermophilus]SNT68327.1 hypothetical protein SAMN06297382_0829 [Amphiplicatus metriothermophilus]